MRKKVLPENSDLAELAKKYLQDTGLVPQHYEAAKKHGAQRQGLSNALLADLDWYYRHTQEVTHNLRRAINVALG